MLGFYIDYQKMTVNYENFNLFTDTQRVARKDYARDIPVQPLIGQQRYYSWNYNFYGGLMYISTGQSVNFKSFINIGLNALTYPTVMNTRGVQQSQRIYNTFIRFHTDATLVSSAGLSIGLEAYVRGTQAPLFNFTFTKVLDIRQIGSLFGKVPSVKL
jgi:hypothetical protein